MKTFVRFVSAIPFSGKAGISPLYFSFLGSRSKSEQTKNYVSLLLLLILFVVGHSLQVGLGIEGLSFNAPYWAKSIFLLYAVANACVVIVQFYLIVRSTNQYLRGRLCRTERTVRSFSYSESTKMALVTLGCQIAMIVPFLIYQ